MNDVFNALFKDLMEKTGTNLHTPLARAFELLEFKTEIIEEQDVEPDLIAYSNRSDPKYSLIIEISVRSKKRSTKANKTGQLRQVERYKSILLERGFKNSYYVLIGKHHFSDSIIKSSEPNICLITIEEIITLIKEYQIYHFSHEDLEIIFRNYGSASKNIEILIRKYRKKILICALIFLKLSIIKGESIDKKKLLSAVKTLAEIFLLKYNVLDTEIISTIDFLGSDLLNFFSLDHVEDNVICTKNSNTNIKFLIRKLGKLGKEINTAYIELFNLIILNTPEFE